MLGIRGGNCVAGAARLLVRIHIPARTTHSISSDSVPCVRLGLDFPLGRAQPSAWRWAVATVIAVGASLAACVGLAALGVTLFPSTAGYPHFEFADYSRLTIAGVLAACVAWPLVTLVSTRARRLFFLLAVLVVLASLAPDVWILHLGQPLEAVAVLMAMHVALGLITYPALVLIAPQSRGHPNQSKE